MSPSVPRIFLLGAAVVVLEAGDVYQDAGASATDDIDGDLSSALASDATSFNSSRPGSHDMCYRMTRADSQGLFATPVCRTVQVIDTTPPVRLGLVAFLLISLTIHVL